MRLVGIVIAAVAGLALVGCGGEERVRADGGRQEFAQQAAQGGATAVTPEGITVVGTGSATAAPDVAEWSFGVRSEAESAKNALATNAAAARRVIRALRSAGVRRDSIRTEQVSLWTQTDDNGRHVVGYTATNSVHVTVRIARAGAIVDAAVRAGANEVSGPTMIVSDTDAQYTQALDVAFDDARRHAEAIAAKAGVSLGPPLAIVESGGIEGPVIAERAVLDAAASAPIEPGKQEITAMLTVTFAIS
jgi:uncharacterized protein